MACTVPRSIWDLGADLGEGPLWVERDRALWFVDIKKHKLYRYDPQSGAKRSWDAPDQVCFAFPAESGGLIVGLPDGLYRFDPASGAFDLIVHVEADKPRNRLNDGVVDPNGRLWFGTMDNEEKDKTGAFYCFVGGKVHPTGIDAVEITNGPAVSPDGATLYVVDTVGRTIEQVDIHDDGSLGERRPFVTIESEAGHPDGPTVDSEGCVWIGLYGGWEARRYSAGGDLVDHVRFPVANITKLAFGGDDLRTVFATTASQLLSADSKAKQPLAGDLFEFRCDVPGVPCPPVRF